MKNIEEIGKVIRITESDEENTFHVHNEIVMDGKEYRILPLRCGDHAEIAPNNKEKLVAKVKQDLFKHLEDYIEIFVNNDLAFTHKIWANASLVIIVNKEENKN